MAKLVRIYMLLPAMLVLYMVFYPFAANLFYTNTEIMDNRPLHEKPVKFTRNYAREFEDYYNDTFAGRKKIISKYVKLQKRLKIDAGQYFYGQNGWIFYDSIKANNGNTLVDYYAEVYFDDEDLAKMAKGINMAYDFYAKRGIKYVIFVAPNKENVYSEFMPERMQRIRKSEISRMDHAVEYLKKHTKAEIINAKPAMLAAKKDVEQNLYFKKDTHWNYIGGYVGFEQLAQGLRHLGVPLKVPALEKLHIDKGKLRDMDMEVGAQEWTYEVSYQQKVLPQCQPNVKNGDITDCLVSQGERPERLLVWVDSFAEGMLPYLSRAFKTSYYAPAGLKKLSEIEAIVNETKPDVVVDELIERYFSRFANYPRVFGGEYD